MNRTFTRMCRLTLLLVLLLPLLGAKLYAYDLTVAKDGSGNYTTVQAAINAAPTNGTALFTIYIKDGRYKEKITVPSNKPFLQLVGQSVANTILTYDDGASSPAPTGGTLGTQNSASFTVSASDFSAINITFENSFGDGSQAVAVLVNADRAAFKNCRFLGNQDTLYVKGNGTPRHYFTNCYIDGNVDFIFGSAIDWFESCVVYAKARPSTSSSYITAANTPPGQMYGFIFQNATIPSNTGGTLYYLGRPWQNSTGFAVPTENKVVFLNATVGTTIQPAGWTTWDAGTNTSIITYAEYKTKNFDGTLADVSQRVPWSKQLTDAQAAAYTRAAALGDWDPCTISADFCTALPLPLAVSNFKGMKGATTSTFTWNLSWPMANVKYELFRSSNRKTGYTKLNEVTGTDAANVNFSQTDAVPASGSNYYYYLRASKDGLTAHVTDTVTISSTQTIVVAGTLSSFKQGVGLPSAPQSYTVSATNLTAPLVITPPANYQLSTDNGATWSGPATPITLTATNGTLAATTINVRLNATAAGTYSGNITHTSTGAATVNVAVTGTVQSTPLPTAITLQYWPLTRNNQDSTAVRSAGVTASMPTLKRLYVSNGTEVPDIKAYSTKFGQAFGATADGSGAWGTGPGGNLNRLYYEQFTITAAAGRSVRVDSLVLMAAFYNTSSNTKLAVVYSKSGFATDSASVTGGVGPTGSGLASTANGAFETPIALANQTSGPTNTYHLALNGADGVTLAAGQTLSIRLYFSCGSSSAGRYAMLKNVVAKGNLLTVTGTRAAVAKGLLQAYPNPAHDQLLVAHPAASQGASVTLYTFDGRRVAVYPSAPGTTQTRLNVAALASGNYLLLYTGQNERITAKIVKQ